MKVRVPIGRLRSAPGFAMRVFRRMPKIVPTSFRLLVATATVLVLIGGAAAAQVVIDPGSKLPAGVALRVGDLMITDKDLQQRVHILEVVYGVQAPTDPKQLDQFNRATAKAIAVSEILNNTAKSRGIVISDKSANDQVSQIIQQNFNNDRASYLQYLADANVAEASVTQEFARQLASAQLFGSVTKDAKSFTDQDAQNYYNTNKSQMVSPEQRDIRNIVIADQQQADLVAQQAKSGTDFAGLVSQYSIDASTNKNSGDLGMVTASQLDSGYAKVAFAAPANSVFGPVQTAQGWNVGQVTKIQPPAPLSFDQLKDTIKTKLDNDAKFQMWGGWLTEQLKSADTQYAPQYLPADPTAPPPSPTGE